MSTSVRLDGENVSTALVGAFSNDFVVCRIIVGILPDFIVN